jgi:uncharacterized protein CbrC (UPF0167 family)
LGAEFFDSDGVGGFGSREAVPSEVVATLVERTPGFSGWQQEQWFTCCGDAAAFLGCVGTTELVAHGDAAVEAIRTESGRTGSDWSEYLATLRSDGSPTAYLFQCLACGKFGGYSDCD